MAFLKLMSEDYKRAINAYQLKGIDQFVVTRWLDNSLNKYYKNADWDLFIKADGMMDVNTFYNVPKTTIQTGAHGGMFFYCLSKLNDCCHICMIMKRNLVEYLMNFKFTL